ncbi:C-x8-C-x5-C-x3-H type zinc finger protein [Apiospora hydei]|uniref:C-x8-C-x5-C-x3-H type zinc finger protein n=1 Tax=Apiospora hydei TaxID=1337664 RepID=A0ABR1X9R9_9PEZI
MADVEMSMDIASGYDPLAVQAEYNNYLNMDESRNKFILARYLNDDYIDDPFVAVVVEGDGAIFTDELLKNPAQAADKLKAAVRAQLLEMPSLPISIPIVVRIYANLHGLAKTVAANSIIDYNDMAEFPSKFNFECDYFDFVDVGRSKEAADSKIRCKRIFLAGVTHDAGYLNDLKEFKGDQGDRITLVESYPDVFRTEMLPSQGAPKPRRQSQEQTAPPLQMDHHGTGNDAALMRNDGYPRPSERVSKMNDSTGSFYNRSHVRIDRILKHPGNRNEPHQISFVRKKNGRQGFCNDHYLGGGGCTRTDCKLINDVVLEPRELDILRYLARLNFRCYAGPKECRNMACYKSHTCPYPKWQCPNKECNYAVHLGADPEGEDRKAKYVLFEDYDTEMIELED